MTGSTDHRPPPRSKTLRVRWYIAAALISVVLCSLTVSIAVISTTGHQAAVDGTDDIVERIGARTAAHVTQDLSQAIESLEMLHVMLRDDLAALPGPLLDRTLAAQLDTTPQLSGLFVGYPSGAFRFVRRSDDALIMKKIVSAPIRTVTETTLDDDLHPVASVELDDSYDPVVRPWYLAAMETDGIAWTEPYVFFSSGEPGVTAAIAVRGEDGEIRAVVGADVSLASLSSALDDLPIDPDADAFLLAGDRVVAAPTGYDVTYTTDAGRVALAPVSALGDDIASAIASGKTESDGGALLRCILIDDPVLPAWSIIVRTDRIEFIDSLRRQSRLAMTATALSAILLLGVIAVFVSWLRRPFDELGQRARIDSLTGLPNRHALLEDGGELVRECLGADRDLVVAVLDIDDFKAVNDRFGHAAGDAALRRLATGLQLALRPGDVVGRLGGDEFVMVVPRLDRSLADLFLRRLQDVVTAELRSDGPTKASTVTIGATTLDRRDRDLEALIEEADAQLLASKRGRKGTISWTTDPLPDSDGDQPASAPTAGATSVV